jgi:hypothetical protein
LVLALFAAAGLLLSGSGSAHADGIPVVIGNLTLPPSGGATEDLRAINVFFPKLGAWQIDVQFQPEVVDALPCTFVQPNSYCNPNYAANKVRIVGSSAAGLSGSNIILARLQFECVEPGTSQAEIVIGQLVSIDSVAMASSVQSGTVTCPGGSAVGGVSRLADVEHSTLAAGRSSGRAPIEWLAFGGGVAGLLITTFVFARRRSQVG